MIRASRNEKYELRREKSNSNKQNNKKRFCTTKQTTEKKALIHSVFLVGNGTVILLSRLSASKIAHASSL